MRKVYRHDEIAKLAYELWDRRGHPPERAISDGAQSLDLNQFAKMMDDLKPYIALWKEARKKETVAAAAR